MATFVLSSSSGMRSRFSRMVLVAVATMPETEVMIKQTKRYTIETKASYQIERPYDWHQSRRRRQLVVAGEPCTLWVPRIQCRIDWALHVPIDRLVGCALDPSRKVEELHWSYCTCSISTYNGMRKIRHVKASKEDIPIPSVDELDVGVDISSATAATSNDSVRYEMNWLFSFV